MVFMAMARVVWASKEMEPYDMAPVTNLFTISLAGSTCSQAKMQIQYANESLQAWILHSLFGVWEHMHAF